MRRILGTSLVLAALAAPLSAQNANCAAASTATADACEKATDLYGYMMPQHGTSLVGGSHTLGVCSTLGGFGHFAVALRGNAVMGDLPDLRASRSASPARRAATSPPTRRSSASRASTSRSASSRASRSV